MIHSVDPVWTVPKEQSELAQAICPYPNIQIVLLFCIPRTVLRSSFIRIFFYLSV